jgi:hypothetical protein
MRKLFPPSPAFVVASVALFVALGGGAWAASSGGGHGTAAPARILGGHRTLTAHASAGTPGPRGPRGPRGFTGKQGPAGPPGAIGPSDGYVTRVPASQSMPAGQDTQLAHLSLTPNSSYIVTAATELGGASATAGLVSCTLLENFNPLATGSANLPAENVFAQTITLTAATTGGNIKLSCNPDNSDLARSTVITAIKVGTLHTQ